MHRRARRALYWYRLRRLAATGDIPALRATVEALAARPGVRRSAPDFAPLVERIHRYTDSPPDPRLADRLAIAVERECLHRLIHGVALPEVFGALVSELQGEELLAHPTQQGRGAVVVGSHLGYIHLIPAKLRQMGYRVKAIIGRGGASRRHRRLVQYCLLPHLWQEIADEGRTIRTGGAFAKALSHLEAGGVLYTLGDGRVRAQTEAPFLGGRGTFPDGPYVLAARAKAALVTAVLQFGEAGELSARIEAVPPAASATEALRHYVSRLDAWVRQRPDLWYQAWGGYLAAREASLLRASGGPDAR